MRLQRVLTALHALARSHQMRTGEAPLEVTCRLMCKWRDSEYYPVRVIEKRKRDPSRGGGPLAGDASDFDYYVHYEPCAGPQRAACAPASVTHRVAARSQPAPGLVGDDGEHAA